MNDYISRKPLSVFPLVWFSLAVMALEVFLSRLLSYCVPVILLYALIGIAMLGFGIAGSLVAVCPQWVGPDRVNKMTASWAIGFVWILVASHACVARLTAFINDTLISLVISALLTAPFLAAGVVITLALSQAGARIGGFYAANLLGSGLGCFLPLVLLGPLDGEHFIALLAGCSWLAAVAFVLQVEKGARSGLWNAAWAALALAVLTWLDAERVFPIQPEPAPTGQVEVIRDHAQRFNIKTIKAYDRWNPVGRIQIYGYSGVPGGPEPYPFMFFAQDSTAGSILARWDGRDRGAAAGKPDDPNSSINRLCAETIYAQGYFRDRPRVLVIGLGGGPDVQCALYNRARRVDVVEINPDSVAAVTGRFSEWLGGLGARPGVRYFNRDGRSYVHGSGSKGYDLVQLSGVDTKQVFASGTLVLSENHLYTREAFDDYLKSLAPGGVLSITRFGEIEALRLVNTAAAALRRLGVDRPRDHIAILRNGLLYGVLVGRRPFSSADAQSLRRRLQPPDFRGVKVLFYEIFNLHLEVPLEIVTVPGGGGQEVFSRFFSQLEAGNLDAFVRGYDWDISPTSDDRPFFFDIYRYDRPATWASAPPFVILGKVLGSILLLSVAFIVLPVSSRPGGIGRNARWAMAGYFGSIGLAYLFVEVWLLHRFSMYLGSQTYSLMIVLASLLVSSGLGSLSGRRVVARLAGRAAVGAALLAALVVLEVSVLPAVLEATWDGGLLTRAAAAIGFVFPLGFIMGIPFPLGIFWVKNRHADSVPWCIGINGFASVVATVAAIPIAMTGGYRAILLLGAALYVSAGMLALRIMRGAKIDAVVE